MLFEHEETFSPKSTEELRAVVESPGRSVVYRARCISELGRRAAGEAGVVEDLLRWAADASMRRSKWVGTVSLAGVAAAAVGYSQEDPAIRGRLREILEGWVGPV